MASSVADVCKLSTGTCEFLSSGPELAFQEQSLALAAAQVLYLYAWFTRTCLLLSARRKQCFSQLVRTGEIMRANIILSAQLLDCC